MTRKKDVFWGIYAAIIPCFFINISVDITWRLNEYRSRTFDVAGPMMGILLWLYSWELSWHLWRCITYLDRLKQVNYQRLV